MVVCMRNYNIILEHIQKKIIPKYSEIESCTFYVMPNNFKEKFLLICKVPVDLLINEKKTLESKIIEDLSNFDKYLVDRVNIIFIQF